MKIKKKKNKKVLISAAICLALGGMLGGIATTSPQEELNNAVAKNSEVVSEISRVTKTLESKESEFKVLDIQATNLEEKKDELVQIEQETKEQLDAKIKAKEEAKAKAEEEARLKAEAETKAKAEAQAKAEVQAKAQSSQASSSTNSTQNSTGGSNGSGGGGSSGAIVAAPSSESSSIKVWKTATGKKYHKTNNCGNTNSSNATLITITEAQNLGLTSCSKCY